MTDTEPIVEQTEFEFCELSDKAKENARDDFKSCGYPYDEWYSHVYEDAISIGKILGLDIENIFFSGFSCQGDGASFRGSYKANVDAFHQMKEYCNDDELIRIATQLTAMQIARRLLGLLPFEASITQSGRYSHSHTMNVKIHFEEDEEDPVDAITDDVTKLFRDFADWIYRALEAEYDYLCSDEVIDDLLSLETFDEDGNTI